MQRICGILIDQGLLKAAMPEEEKATLRNAVMQLPATALNTVVTQLLQNAMDDPLKAVKTIAEFVGIDM